jgi:hypothetical protein
VRRSSEPTIKEPEEDPEGKHEQHEIGDHAPQGQRFGRAGAPHRDGQRCDDETEKEELLHDRDSGETLAGAGRSRRNQFPTEEWSNRSSTVMIRPPLIVEHLPNPSGMLRLASTRCEC